MLFTSELEDKLFWEKVAEFDRELLKITTKKGSDYNKTAAFPDYCPNGWRDSAVMLWKHSLRFQQLSGTPSEKAANETIDETLLDIANYARYTWAMRRLAEHQTTVKIRMRASEPVEASS